MLSKKLIILDFALFLYPDESIEEFIQTRSPLRERLYSSTKKQHLLGFIKKAETKGITVLIALRQKNKAALDPIPEPLTQLIHDFFGLDKAVHGYRQFTDLDIPVNSTLFITNQASAKPGIPRYSLENDLFYDKLATINLSCFFYQLDQASTLEKRKKQARITKQHRAKARQDQRQRLVEKLRGYINDREEADCFEGFRNLKRLNGQVKIQAATKLIAFLEGQEQRPFFTKKDREALTETESNLGFLVASNRRVLGDLLNQILDLDHQHVFAPLDPRLGDLDNANTPESFLIQGLLRYIEARRSETGWSAFFRNFARFDEQVKTDAADKVIDLLMTGAVIVWEEKELAAINQEDSQLNRLLAGYVSTIPAIASLISPTPRPDV